MYSERVVNPILPTLILLVSGAGGPGGVAQELPGNGGILYGDNHAFMVQAPEGWILDNQSGVDQGLHAVFYPSGSTWADSEAVMYVNTTQKEPPHETVEQLIQDDVKMFLEHSPNLQVLEKDSLTLDDGKVFQVREFSGDQWGNHESIAYVEEETILVVIVLTSRNENQYLVSLDAFEQLVRSYLFMTTDVEIIE